MPIPLPNELLIFILSDVIGTYVHSFILLPSNFHCWPGHYILRSVSKHFKALTDDTWNSAIGGERGQVELLNIRTALYSKGTYVPPNNLSSPLMVAYMLYVVALIRQGFSRERRVFEAESGGNSTHPNTALNTLPETWLELAWAQTIKVRPREVGYILEDAVYLATDSYFHDTHAARARNLINRAADNIRISEGTEEAIELLEDCISPSLTLFMEGKPRYLDYASVMTLEMVVRSYPPWAHNADELAQESLVNSRRNLAEYVSLLKEAWSDWNSFNEVRKRTLHKAATLRVQSPRCIAIKSRHEKPPFYFLHSKRTLLTDSRRCVSKQVKALVDDIWISVIGSGDMGQRDLAKIRDAMLNKRGAPVPNRTSKPLIAAYACYAVALYKLEYPNEYPSEDLGHQTDDKSLTTKSSYARWLQAARALTYNVRPREAGHLLQADIEAVVKSCITNVTTSTAHDLIKMTLKLAVQHVSLGVGELEHLFKRVYCLVKAVSLGANFMHIVPPEVAGRSLVQQPPVEVAGQYQKFDEIFREMTASFMALLNATWLERIATQESRKRELHRVATYGIRRQSPDS